ncbi:MAG: DsbA family protein [Bdellovibrionales bacterium]
MHKVLLFLAAALIGFLPCSGFAAESPAAAPKTPVAANTFTDAQRGEIEIIIRDYLTEKHPEILAQGLQNLQQRDQEAADAKTKEKIASEKDRLFNDSATPIAGNPKAKVTLLEFYDYLCGYCKMAEDAVEKVLKEDKDVKVVYKNYPILGPVSLEAAKAGLASVKQGKFQEFHSALMNKKEHLTSEMIYQVAKEVGIDVEKLKKTMGEASINDAINASLKLGQDLGVRGTPFFIVNSASFPGVLNYEQLKNAVDAARKAK